STHGVSNFGAYGNPVVDRLLDSAKSASALSVRAGYVARAEQMIVDDAPAVWLYDMKLILGANQRIAAAPLRGDEWWAHLADWTVDPAHRLDRDRLGLARTQ